MSVPDWGRPLEVIKGFKFSGNNFCVSKWTFSSRGVYHHDRYLTQLSYPTSDNEGLVGAESSWRSGMIWAISGNLQFVSLIFDMGSRLGGAPAAAQEHQLLRSDVSH
jgi:hypothetical protein